MAKYFEVKDFVIKDERTFHFYNDDETPFKAFNFQIGILNSGDPITRWMTEKQYDRLLSGACSYTSFQVE